MNPGGEVVKEHLDDVITVNGHSYKEKFLPNTNFAVLVSTYFTELSKIQLLTETRREAG